ncbi:MAG TPA: histidine kinase [Vicinamibacterales bacterium]|jgi:signal transduction histidine kinase
MITGIAVCSVQAALVAALLVQRSRRRQMEQALRPAEAALRSSCTDAEYLAERLIATQESERSRLARYLHDNLGQKLARLCMDIQCLDTYTSRSPAEIAVSVSQLLECATDITRDMGCLAHDLHPPKLDILGLAPALGSLCREMLRQGQLRIEPHFHGARVWSAHEAGRQPNSPTPAGMTG